MHIDEISNLLMTIKGCTFASIDAETQPFKGCRRETRNEQVILFTNKHGSGYENMVKRRLEQAGKDPDGFSVGDLPWGERIPNSPIIHHKGLLYLQTILLRPGVERCFIGNQEVPVADVNALMGKKWNNQGLPEGKAVVVKTYNIENLQRISVVGEEVFASPKPGRKVLSLKTDTKGG